MKDFATCLTMGATQVIEAVIIALYSNPASQIFGWLVDTCYGPGKTRESREKAIASVAAKSGKNCEEL